MIEILCSGRKNPDASIMSHRIRDSKANEKTLGKITRYILRDFFKARRESKVFIYQEMCIDWCNGGYIEILCI